MGTEAGFAVSLINKKLGAGDPLSLHIEAVKEGEEPISFGPSSALVDYGSGWRLQTVSLLDSPGNSLPSLQSLKSKFFTSVILRKLKHWFLIYDRIVTFVNEVHVTLVTLGYLERWFLNYD